MDPIRPPLRFFNSLSRSVEAFEPLEPGHVRMYHCGPTVYGYPHIGNLLAFLLGDLLRRALERWGYRVTQVMNITDVGHLTNDQSADGAGEDKLERKARALRRTPWDLARHYSRAFFADLEALDVRAAHYYPRATEFVPEMVQLIERLIAKGLAYATADGNVYYDVAAFPGYGRLSGNTLASLEAGARVEVRDDKRSPHDFALWKRDPAHLMQWPSPWGSGFPGWHIECSAMSMRFLGESFDIHTGGEDNLFPHHECEIAQSEGATGKPFARFWLHTRFMTVDGQKMSKSLGNVYTLSDLAARGYSAREVRYALVKTHYRTAQNFTFAGLDEARHGLKRLDACIYRLEQLAGASPAAAAMAATARVEAPSFALADELVRAFDAAVADDLNVSVAMSVLWRVVGEANKHAWEPAEADALLATLRTIDGVLGFVFPMAELVDGSAAQHGGGAGHVPAEGAGVGEIIPAAVTELVQARQEARAKRDFAAADGIRQELKRLGFVVEDRPEGPRVVRSGSA